MLIPTLHHLPGPPPGKKGWPWTEGVDGPQHEGMDCPEALPKISIVTPSFNQAATLEETIRSVLLQGYPNLEYMIIDGNSSDASSEIIQKYEPWLAYWVSEPDRGQSHAINKGWRRASGKILAWMNSDDLYEKNVLYSIAGFFNENKNVGMVYGDCQVIDINGNFLYDAPTRAFDFKSLVCNQWFISQPAAFFKKEMIQAVGDINESLHLIMDWELFLRAALKGFAISYLPKPLARFRQWPNAKTSSQAVRSATEKLYVLNSVFNNPEPAARIEPFRNDAFGYVHRWTGMAYYRNNNSFMTLYHLIKAIKHQPSYLSDKEIRQTVQSIFYGKCFYRSFCKLALNLRKAAFNKRSVL